MLVRSVPTAIAVAIGLLVVPFAALGDHLRVYDYSVLRDGEPIGLFNISFETSGRTQRVEVVSDVAVTIGPITLFRLVHQRSEIWHDNVLVESVAHTEKNGDVFEIEITREDDGYKRVLNGRIDKFDSSVEVLALWHESLFTGSTFISAFEDDVMSLSIVYQGEQEVALSDGIVAAQHYKMTGDSERDLWFDADGHLVKLRFSELLSDIEYVLDTGPSRPEHRSMPSSMRHWSAPSSGSPTTRPEIRSG